MIRTWSVMKRGNRVCRAMLKILRTALLYFQMYGITNITVRLVTSPMTASNLIRRTSQSEFAKRADKTYDEQGSKIAQPSLGRRSYLPSDKLTTSKDICRRDPENIGNLSLRFYWSEQRPRNNAGYIKRILEDNPTVHTKRTTFKKL